jgi:hypothetical protein
MEVEAGEKVQTKKLKVGEGATNEILAGLSEQPCMNQ